MGRGAVWAFGLTDDLGDLDGAFRIGHFDGLGRA